MDYIIKGGIPFVFSTALWAFDFSTDIKGRRKLLDYILSLHTNNSNKIILI